MKSIVFCRIVVDENHRNEPLQKETARGFRQKHVLPLRWINPHKRFAGISRPQPDDSHPGKLRSATTISILLLFESNHESPVRKSARKKPRRRARGDAKSQIQLHTLFGAFDAVDLLLACAGLGCQLLLRKALVQSKPSNKIRSSHGPFHKIDF